MVDPDRKLLCGKSPEHNRVNRAQPGTGETGFDRLGNHGHVDDDPVAGGNAPGGKGTGQPGDPFPEFGEGDAGLGAGYRTVMDDCRGSSRSPLNMPVHRVPACIDLRVPEPLIVRCVVGEERALRPGRPVDRFAGAHPECLRVCPPAFVYIPIVHCPAT